MKLEKGKIYDLTNLRHVGWLDDNKFVRHLEDVYAFDYFEDFEDQGVNQAKYLGPDQYGLEPLFEENE